MSETDYVELAFWSGWVEAHGQALPFDDLCEMAEALKDRVSDLARDYLETLADGDSEEEDE